MMPAGCTLIHSYVDVTVLSLRRPPTIVCAETTSIAEQYSTISITLYEYEYKYEYEYAQLRNYGPPPAALLTSPPIVLPV
jgi:hypothetical protein